jgi:moderate conductance mechanosensitive channel
MHIKLTAWLAALLLSASMAGARAQETPAPAPAEPPAEVRELIDLLRKPAVQDWLAKGAPAGSPVAATTEAVADIKEAGSNLARDFRRWVADTRGHVATIRDGAEQIPQELARIGGHLAVEVEQQGLWQIAIFAGGLLLLGYGCQQLFWVGTRGWRKRVLATPLDTVTARLDVVGQRLAYNLLWLLSFAVGSLGALLLFNWPPYLKSLLSGIFLTIVVAILWGALARFLLSPNNPKLRVFPTSDASARHWSRWDVILLAWFFGGYMAMQVLQDFDVDRPVRLPIAYFLGIVLFLLAMVALWRRPALSKTSEERRSKAFNVTLGVSALFAAFWALWFFGMMKAFWLLLVVAGLPAAIRVVDRSVDHVLTPPGSEAAKGPPNVVAAALERGARAFLIIGAISLLAWGWGVDLDTLSAGETIWIRALRGVFNALIILLVADFAWHVIRTLIDQHIHASQEMEGEEQPDPNEASRRSRMRTLLPILRNILFIVFLVMAALMALSSTGVQIGPLIAGAGLVGVAVGFGAQTLVRDVISGIFYLLDDAFRVGEYIISGSYKGTVESFSLRSIKLRHHRGYLYTVPFGTLGAVQNMSRDWVIDKLQLTVPYDTDLDLLKKLVKQIGKDLAADPELAQDIIQPLKMQGVEAMGEIGMQIRLKMMTKPGEQFIVRRRAYAMLKQRLAENGIRIATPTVQVSDGDSGAAAAAAIKRQTAAEEATAA